jgi:hypothetical protein
LVAFCDETGAQGEMYYKIFNKDEMDWACGTYGKQERLMEGLVENPEGREPFGRPRRGWDDIIQMNLKLYALPLVGRGVW